MFSVPFDEIGAILDRSPDAARQLASRGRRRIRGADTTPDADPAGRPALINGAAGWVSLLDGEVYAVAALTLRNGRIATMDILLDPARLARLDLTAFDSRRHGGD
jgi:hypothetical protein